MNGEVGLKVRMPRRRVAIGPKRPQYLASSETDRVLMMLTALVAEVSALRDRLTTHEDLAQRGLVATVEAVEAYRPDAERAAAREAERTAMLKRVYRVITEELDSVDQTKRDAGDWAMPDGWDKT